MPKRPGPWPRRRAGPVLPLNSIGTADAVHNTVVRTNLATGAIASIVAAVLAAGAPVRAGQQAASRLVLTSVADARGQPLVDLGPDDFVVSENGEPREVSSVYPADYPVVVLVDTSAGASGNFTPLREAVAGFLRRVGQRIVVLGTLADPPALLTAIDDERSKVQDQLEKLTTGPATVLLPIEAVAAAARMVRDSGSPFAAIVVVSAHRIDSAQAQSTRLLPDIFDNNAIVHVVSRSAATTAPRGPADAIRFNADLLRDLADQTRGSFTTVFSAPSYAVALGNVADRLGTDMVVECLGPAAPVRPGEVQVGVRIPGARVRGLRISK